MKIFCLCLLCALGISVSGQQTGSLIAKVDERIELLGIVARLADYEEYSFDYNRLYAADIHAYFDRYRDHPAVVYARKIRKNESVQLFGHDALAALAVRLGPPPELEPQVASPTMDLGDRWGTNSPDIFVKMLRQFYADTDFGTFFKAHEKLYAKTERLFQKTLNGFDPGWFRDYYGVGGDERFHVLLGMGNGFYNYATTVFRPDGTKDVFSVIGTGASDPFGNPVVSSNFLPMLVHEFGHLYGNMLVYRHMDVLGPIGRRLFDQRAADMSAIAYPSGQLLLNESMVRAVTIRYFANRGEIEMAREQLRSDMKQGFLWTGDLFDLLVVYESQRNVYPVLDDFVPKIAECLSAVADSGYYQPTVVSIREFDNGDQQVGPDLKTITVRFDRPLDGKGYRIDCGPLGPQHYPLNEFGGYSTDNTSVTIRVELKPDFVYEMLLSGWGFVSREGYPIRDYLIRFKTK